MSHIENIKTKIRDLDALQAACARFASAQFLRGKTQCQYFAGAKAPCDHAIHIDGSEYEIAVKATAEGSYTLGYDSWGASGRRIHEVLGDGLRKLTDAYSAEYLHAEARRQGYTTTEETLSDGTILVSANSY